MAQSFSPGEEEMKKAVDSLPGLSIGKKEARALPFELELKQVDHAHVE
jgi:hypothetical protein